MGCAASVATGRRDSYSPNSQKRPRQNQIVPSQDPEFKPTRTATLVTERQRSAPKNSFSETATSRNRGGVVQSVLKLRTDSYVNQYKLVSSKPIGKGFQSKVYLVENTNNRRRERFAMKALNTKRAIKMANKATDSNLRGVSSADSDEDDVWVEVQVANHVGPHPNIVGMQEVIRDEETGDIFLIMDLMAGGALEKNKKIKRESARSILGDLLRGLSFLHSNGVVHRDIKVDNCLISDLGVAKLGDFGLAHILPSPNSSDQLFKGMGSRKYRAPEVVQDRSGGTGFSGFQADQMSDEVWALGCVLYSLLVGKLPFDGEDKAEQVYNILNKQLKFPSRIKRDPELLDLLTRMLDRNPRHRITVDEALKHSWVTPSRKSKRRSKL